MKIYGLYDQAAEEFVKIQLSANEAIFRRDIKSFIEGLKAVVQQNPQHDMAVVINYPNQFDWFELCDLDIKSGVITVPEVRRLVLQVSQFVEEKDVVGV